MKGWSEWLSHWQPRADFILAGMEPPSFHRIDLDDFPRGIDNVRIDVALDPQLISAATALVAVILREDVQRYFWGQEVKAPDIEAVEVFRDVYVKLSQSVARHTQTGSGRVQLFQLAVFKLLLMLVDKEMAKLRDELDDARAQPARQQSGQSLELHERVVVLSRYGREIRFRVLKDVLREVLRLERSFLYKVRKTILGVGWPLSKQMLGAPALQLGGRGSAEDFIRFFPYLLFDEEKAANLLGHIYGVLGDWLPADLVLPGGGGQEHFREDRSRGDVVGASGLIETERCVTRLVGEQELLHGVPHAFDDVQAVLELFGGLDDHWPGPGRWGDRRLLPEFKRRFKGLLRRLHKAGLLHEIYASHRLKLVYPTLGVPHCHEAVYAYLCKGISRRELLERLAARPEVEDAAFVVARIDAQRKANSADSAAERRLQVLQCVRDALNYRYQLKLAWWMLRGIEDVHLLIDSREIDMSQANGLLQSFRAGGEDDPAAMSSAGHVILKADLRGSTEMTSTMRARNLNPAAYFSRNFYDPITALLKDYGADKVFVEGDAIILIVIERSGNASQQMAVARACGLAKRMLEVVERKNAESQRMELPPLEMGIGIAYTDERPTYLYDGGHKITISPAINRADRLSSCDSGLRRVLGAEGPRTGVEVVRTVAASDRGARENSKLLRFNVNGIELEAAAFQRLAKELKLYRLELQGERGLFYVGRYPDTRGHMHFLAVREAKVRPLVGERMLEEGLEGHCFWQVVTEQGQCELLKQHLADKG